MGRADRVKRVLDAADVDRLLVQTGTEPFLDPAFFYVTGLAEGLFENSSAIGHPDGSIEVVVPKLEAQIAKRAGLEVTVYERRADRADRVADRLAGADRIGYNAAATTVDAHRELAEAVDGELVDVGEEIAAARAVKDAEEIEAIEAACGIVTDLMQELPGLLEPGVSESEVAAEIEHRMRAAGASGPAFPTIAAFGPGSAEPHHGTGDRRLEVGDLALVDFGAVVDRYRSDVTRTFVVGDPTDRQQAIYATVLEAQQAAIDRIAPGVSMASVHEAADAVIEASDFAGTFLHSTGHGLGLATHDGDVLGEGRDDEIEAGMVFTVEPGIYVESEGGVRIEDDVVVTEAGCRLLTGGMKGLEAFRLSG